MGVTEQVTPERGSYTTGVPSVSNRKPALADFVKRLREALPDNVLDVRLYGSEARGEATPESDIDVLVVVQPDSERNRLQERIVDIAFDVNVQFDVFISPCVLSPEILNHPVWRETPFIETVLKEGLRL
jgi:predicted nucleotidyltransferase